MGANSKIEWTWQRVPLASLTCSQVQLALEIGAVAVDAATLLVPGYTFNPWIGCTKVDELCANCYAAAQDAFRHWTPEGWGPGKPRKRTSDANWRKVRAWNEVAGRIGVRQRVFCASLADWLDDDGVPIGLLADLLALIDECQNLDWLLLTKRPQNWRSRVGEAADSIMWRGGNDRWVFDWCVAQKPPANVWVGTSVGTQKSADKRIPELLKIPAKVRFLSCEPLLESIDLARSFLVSMCGGERIPGAFVDWLICGGESGAGARPMHPKWARAHCAINVRRRACRFSSSNGGSGLRRLRRATPYQSRA
jgi:protein gp37